MPARVSILAGALIAFAMAMLAGCESKPKVATTAPAFAGEPPPRNVLIEAHNDRVSKLQTTHSDGVVILDWTDERGDHHEQGDIEIWQTSDNRTALTVSKLGERGLWLGSNQDQWWLFDLLDKDQRTLYHGPHDALGDRLGAVGIRPLALLDLLGLSPIDGESSSQVPPNFNAELNAWEIAADGRGGRLRYAFDPVTLLPVRIELLDAEGAVQAASELSRWESVPVANVAVMARPKMPLTVVIRRSEHDAQQVNGEIKIAFNQTVSTIDDRAMRNIFDLERLTASMRPDYIETATRETGNRAQGG